jgi:hypothetical protein
MGISNSPVMEVIRRSSDVLMRWIVNHIAVSLDADQWRAPIRQSNVVMSLILPPIGMMFPVCGRASTTD